MKIYALSSEECSDKDANNGDCFVVDNEEELVLYDCGCEDYAKWVIKYMEKKNYKKVKIVLSHNDSDHFNGIPYLIEKGKVSSITTVLLLKYIDELLEIIADGRKNRESIKRQIIDMYDNIHKLSGNNLQDAFDYTDIAKGVKIVGPGKEYILNAAAKGLDTTEGDVIDGETITNATSIHLCIEVQNKKVLLTGDSSFESIKKEKLEEYKVIQLSHHGKNEIAQKVFEEYENIVDEVYLVSDNTGNSNGGSDKLETRGQDVRNTKEKGMISLDYYSIVENRKIRDSLNEIFNN